MVDIDENNADGFRLVLSADKTAAVQLMERSAFPTMREYRENDILEFSPGKLSHVIMVIAAHETLQTAEYCSSNCRKRYGTLMPGLR